MDKKMTIKEFKKKYGSRAACLKALLAFRTKENELCFNPKCQSPIDKHFVLLRNRKAFICRRCLRHYYPQVESIFHHSRVKIEDWFEIIFKMLLCRNGISALEIHREFGYSYPTVFRMQQQIRSLMAECLTEEMQDTAVEIDEAGVFTGGKGLSRGFPFKTGRGNLRASGVLAIIERNGRGRLIKIPNAQAETLIPIILKNVPTSTDIYTDCWGAYNQLKKLGYTHHKVNHSEKSANRFVNQETGASTNSAENAFSNLKRNIRGTMRKVTEGNLQSHLDEHSFRHSFRHERDYGFSILMKSLPLLFEAYGEKKNAA